MACMRVPGYRAGKAVALAVALLFQALFGKAAELPKKPEGPTETEATMTQKECTLEELAGLGDFQVSLSGDTVDTCLSRQPCLYYEWHYGIKAGDDWKSRSTGYARETEPQLTTPKGVVTVSHRKWRLFLRPSWHKTYSAAEAAEAPDIVRERILEEKCPITVEEFVLLPGQTYHARIATESYHLPPRPPAFKPVQRTNTVIWISDQPFQDGKPTVPITPVYKHWRY